MGGGKSFREIGKMNGTGSWKSFLEVSGRAIRKYRWSFPFIFLVLIIAYYPAGNIFNDPLSTVILDREGTLLGAKIASDGQWRFPERREVPEKFRKAIIASEDRYFYYHPGFNPVSIIRAVYHNLKRGKIVSGGSTLSMQVIRMARKNKPRTVGEKLIEIFQAFRLELAFSKDEILTMYASHAPFGGNTVGLDAAAWRYFGIFPENLSWAEAATMAVLPNSPALIYPGKNQEKLLAKRNRLLDKIFQSGVIDRSTCELAKTETLPQKPFSLPQLAPHLLERAVKEGQSGKRILTTLDARLQDKVSEILLLHYPQLKANEIENAAALVLEVNSGNVTAYVGNILSAAEDEHGKDVDIITSPRSTGSILKPFLYTAMLNDGLILPNSLIPDIPMQIGGFIPENYTLTYDGAVPAHRALSRSLNIPAVKMLQAYGYDQFCMLMRKIGMTTLTKPADHYGLSLILGGAEADLWDLAGIYASMARTLNHFSETGMYDKNDFHPPSYILKEKVREPEVTSRTSLFDAASIFLAFSAMVEVARPDEEQQWQQFSSSSTIAWKTGTSFGNRDAWSVGVTPGYVVAVWVGNASGEGRPGLTGIGTAAPILFDIFKSLPPTPWFKTPYKEMVQVAVCHQSGFRASGICEQQDTMWVQKKGLRSPVCPFHQVVHLDKTENWQVTSNCESPSDMVHKSWFVLPPVQEWYFRNKNPFYKVLPPFRPGCNPPESHNMEMIYPHTNSRIYLPVDLDGKPGSTVFKVAHRIPRHTVHWHLDDHFIGSTIQYHQMALAPEKGFHTLTLVDENGESLTIRFEIMTKEDRK
ncbi:MAG: penicillin-binding protein 1C [Bacteroidetes bacterium]|nr:penicillin-binding protein 1C [Bacteroidota bacterium]